MIFGFLDWKEENQNPFQFFNYVSTLAAKIGKKTLSKN